MIELVTDQALEEMVSYRKSVTGVDHTIFISPKGYAQHAPRVKVAINPPHSIDPRTSTASVMIEDGELVVGVLPPRVLEQVQHFIKVNRATLLDYWHYRIDTDELRQRLRRIK
jgi:hypothetical protein